MNTPSFIFFGTSEFSVEVLNTLFSQNILPVHIITTPDKPRGRHLTLTQSPVKTWAIKHSIAYSQPEQLKDPATLLFLQNITADVFIVASYGKIIPQKILDIPHQKTLNIHPSLLPKLRGASPIQSTILTENVAGVTIIRLDSKMDHGPIIAQKTIPIVPWPPQYEGLEKTLAHEGALLLALILPQWIAGTLPEIEQIHTDATYTEKIEKIDGEIKLDDEPEKLFRKYQAFHSWPGTYFFVEKGDRRMRLIVTEAILNEGLFEIQKVIPEGKKEMFYRDFLKGL